MKTALDIATLIFLATAAVGLVLLIRILWGVYFHAHPLPKNPWPEEMPNPALDESQKALDHVRHRFFDATGNEKTRLGYEVHRLEIRVGQIERNTFEDQYPYKALGRKKIGVWKQWEYLLRELEDARGHRRAEIRVALSSAENMYRNLDQDMTAELQRYIARNHLILAELRSQGVLLTETEAAGEPGAGSTDGGGPGEEDSPSSTPLEGETAPPAQEVSADDPDDTSGDETTQQGMSPQSQPSQSGGPAETPEPGDGSGLLLRQANMADSSLDKRGKRYADATFDLAWTENGVLANADLSGISFTHVQFRGLHRYRNCNFSQANLTGIEFPQTERPHQFVRCNLSGANFTHSRLNYMVLFQCDLTGTQWRGANLHLVRFHECRMEGVDWDDVDLRRSVMSEDMLATLDFSTAAFPPKNYDPSSAHPVGDPRAGDPQVGDRADHDAAFPNDTVPPGGTLLEEEALPAPPADETPPSED